MATVAVTPQALCWNTFDLDVALSAQTSTADGFLVDVSAAADHKLLLLFSNTSADTAYGITVKAGNALQGVSDLAVSGLAASKMAAVAVESGKFKQVSGDYRGKIRVVCANNAVKMAAVVLP
jgi:hypothetical protein